MRVSHSIEDYNYGDKYIYLANVNLKNVPEKVDVQGYTLCRKNEFHISIMALEKLALMLSPDDIDSASQQLKQDFIEFVENHSMTNFRLSGEYRLVRRDKRVSVVTVVDLENVDKLYGYLRVQHSVDFPTPPTHITVYTLQPEEGISLFSRDALNQDSVVVDIPKLKNMEVDCAKN